jgi:hypothetical protein
MTRHKPRARVALRAAWKAASIIERRRFVAELLVELLPTGAPPQAPAPARSSPSADPTLDEFLARCVVKSPGDRVQSSALYDAYRRLALSLDREPISQKAFSTRLSERGYVKRQSSVIWWVGVALIESAAGGVRCC